MRNWIQRACTPILTALLLALLASCSSGGQTPSTPNAPPPGQPSPTAPLPDTRSAADILEGFVDAVVTGRVEEAWNLYAGSAPGNLEQYRLDVGCDFSVFSFEFPKIQHFFSRAAPFDIVETHGNVSEAATIELALRGADGLGYLATTLWDGSSGGYRVRFLNSGRVSAVPGAPDPLPSPEDPLNFCGIWPGAR